MNVASAGCSAKAGSDRAVDEPAHAFEVDLRIGQMGCGSIGVTAVEDRVVVPVLTVAG